MASKRSAGRTPKITPETHRAIVSAVKVGVPYKYAAEGAGVGERTLMRWLATGRKSTKKNCPYRQLWHDIKVAESASVSHRVRRIVKAARGGSLIERTTVTTTDKAGASTTRTVEKLSQPQWTADAWWLERQKPEEFGVNRQELRDAIKRLDKLEQERATRGDDPPAAQPDKAAGR